LANTKSEEEKAKLEKIYMLDSDDDSTRSTACSSPKKKMDMKSPKMNETWNRHHVKPMGLFDPNIHKEYIQPTNVINNKKALLEKLGNAKSEEKKAKQMKF